MLFLHLFQRAGVEFFVTYGTNAEDERSRQKHWGASLKEAGDFYTDVTRPMNLKAKMKVLCQFYPKNILTKQ